MKKNKTIFLSLAFTAAIASCGSDKEDWVDGSENGRYRDTVSNGQHYRHYGRFWYPIVGGRIAPSLYQGATHTDIRRPGFTPVRSTSGGSVRSGGFGSSAHSSVGE